MREHADKRLQEIHSQCRLHMQVIIRLACTEHAISKEGRHGEPWSSSGTDADDACAVGGACIQARCTSDSGAVQTLTACMACRLR